MILWPRNVYLDHNASTPVAPEVQKAMQAALCQGFGNPSSLHTQGRTAKGIVEKARESVASLLHCRPDRIFFTSGGTEGNNSVIKGVFTQAGRGQVITSLIEHESIRGACRQIESLGAKVTYLPAGRDGRISLESLRAAIQSDTLLISIMHGNNETGAIQPVKEIGQIAQSAGIPFHVDAVQTFGKIPVDVADLGCEFLTLSSHKINGPKGCGALYWRGNTQWIPLVYGGYQEQKMRAGTEGVHQIAGLGAAAQLSERRMDREIHRLRVIRTEFLDRLHLLFPDVTVIEASPEHQLPGTISLVFPGRDNIRLLAGLDCYEVSVSIGSACTADSIEPSHVLMGMGLSKEEALSSIRMSLGTTTTRRDMEYVLEVLKHVLKGDPAGFAYLDPHHLTEDRIKSPGTLLVDLRFPYERILCPTIPGAVEWSPWTVDRLVCTIPKSTEIILMCGTGIFSFSAGYRLANRGYSKIRVVYGGYAAWNPLHPGLIDQLRRQRS